MQENSQEQLIKPIFWTQTRTFRLFVIPGVSMYSFFAILPILLGIYYSLTDWNGYSRKFNFVRFENFTKIIQDERFLNSLNFTFRFTIMLVLFVTIISIIIAVLLNSKIKGITTIRAIYFFPAVMSLLTVSLIFNQIYYRAMPVIGKLLGTDLFNGILASPTKAFWGVLFANLWKGVAIPSILFLAALQTIPITVIEAAIIDGASSFKRFFKIELPFLLPILSVVCVLALKQGILVFDSIMGLTGGGPAGSTESVSFLIYQHGFVENKFSYSIAESIVTGIIIAIISAIQIGFLNKRKITL